MKKIGNIAVSIAMILIVMAGSIGQVSADENTKTKITISFDMGDQNKITYYDDGISLKGGGGKVGGARIGGGKIGGGKVGGAKAPSKISPPPKANPAKNVKAANNIAGERSTGSVKGVGSSQYNRYRPSPLSPDYYSARRFDSPAPSHSFFGPIPWWYYPILFHNSNSGSYNTGGNAAYNQSSNSSSWK
ncbi:MAG: hypothetical protein WC788_09285 [Candidatus Paceibacterota bacterium]|jgi:hypothetical protein